MNATAKQTHGPKRIWATVNGVRTEYPGEKRWLIGGWEERDLALHTVEYVRGDLVDDLVTALTALEASLRKDSRDKTIMSDTVEYHLDGQVMYCAINAARAALSRATSPACE